VVNVNDVLYLKIMVANRYMKRHNMTPDEFLKFAEEKDLFGYLDLAYEPLHLTGPDGIMNEVEHFVSCCDTIDG
jgi:hypothetical protein